ncbi:hypothetical protein FB480_101893 [Agrobacterium vitis]|nr:hypothetical protein FB480_101893 [Agrobacterium vitis]
MTPDDVRTRAAQLTTDIQEILEGENPDAALLALSSMVGVLIFHNTGNVSEAAGKAGEIGTNITKITRDLYQKYAETVGA